MRLDWRRKQRGANGFQSTHLCKVRPNTSYFLAHISQFQSTHLCKVRPCLIGCTSPTLIFQSTHLCKVRPDGTKYFFSRFLDFNPLTCVRWDLAICCTILAPLLFQSTHLCKVRLDWRRKQRGANGFQSTHLCKVRHLCMDYSSWNTYFNPLTCVRWDILSTKNLLNGKNFNPLTCVRWDIF